MSTSNSTFNFFVPFKVIQKGEKEGDPVWIEGVANSETEDSDGETLMPSGFDFRPLLNNGFFNWDHQAKKNPAAIVGQPTEAKLINGNKDFWVKGFLYPDHAEAQAIGNLAQVLEKHSPNRRLGFSIEGIVLEKDPLNPKRIRRARITNIAITTTPKNSNTFVSLVKGEYNDLYVPNEQGTINIPDLIQEYKNWAPQGSMPSEDSVLDFMTHNHEDHLHLIPELIKAIVPHTCPQCDHDQLIAGTCLECGYVEKAMEVDQALTPHAVEGDENRAKIHSAISDNGKSPNTTDEKVARNLTKSEIYNSIIEKYPNENVGNIQEVYRLTTAITKKFPTMAITKSLQKAFSMLDEATALIKGEDAGELNKQEEYPGRQDDGEEEKDKDKSSNSKEEDDDDDNEVKKGEEDDDDDDDQEEVMNKAMSMCKSYMAKGMSEDKLVGKLEKAGFSKQLAETACSNCIAEASAKKDGGDTQTLGGLSKGEIVDLVKSVSSQVIGSAQTELSSLLVEKLGNLVTAIQDQQQENSLLKSEVASMSEQLERIANQPIGTKSVRNVRHMERFNQEQEGKEDSYNLKKAEDVRTLTDVLYNKALELRKSQKPNLQLESVVTNLEVAKQISKQDLPVLRSLGIKVYSE